MSELINPTTTPRIWQVGALCRAIADVLGARFNPVMVRGELSGYTRAASGHCYFSLKDESGQLRCAMFRRSAALLDFSPRDGELVEVQGRLGVYEPRGDLQLVVESMRRAGQGALFEQFLRLKAHLEAQGLFDASRKRPLAVMPRAIGVVTSLGAAALHDVASALQRRIPHIPVVLAPASVQGGAAPQEMIEALSNLYRLTPEGRAQERNEPQSPEYQAVTDDPVIDAILLVRGGGSLEDLWAFNDEQLALMLVQSPVPIICGIGHETDFTIADFVADVRAPTPTAAAELVTQPREVWLGVLEHLAKRYQDAALRQIDRHSQRLDMSVARLGRPSDLVAQQRLRLAALAQRLQFASRLFFQQRQQEMERMRKALPDGLERHLEARGQHLQRTAMRLSLLDPALVLARGYAWLHNPQGQTITSVQQLEAGQALRATLADGEVDLTVAS